MAKMDHTRSRTQRLAESLLRATEAMINTVKLNTRRLNTRVAVERRSTLVTNRMAARSLLAMDSNNQSKPDPPMAVATSEQRRGEPSAQEVTGNQRDAPKALVVADSIPRLRASKCFQDILLL